jgi:hypothetical protein
MIHNGCRFGLEYVTTILPGDATVHLLLDDISMNRVVDRLAVEPRMGGITTAKPITYSELRFAYRSWSRMGERSATLADLRKVRAAKIRQSSAAQGSYDAKYIRRHSVNGDLPGMRSQSMSCFLDLAFEAP